MSKYNEAEMLGANLDHQVFFTSDDSEIQRVCNRSTDNTAVKNSIKLIPIIDIQPDPNNSFDLGTEEEMESLMNSINEIGMNSPLYVRLSNPKWGDPDSKYVTVGGERRLTALRRINYSGKVRCIIKEFSNKSEVISDLVKDNMGKADRKFAYGAAANIKLYKKTFAEENGIPEDDVQWENVYPIPQRTRYVIMNLMLLDDEILLLGQRGLLTFEQGDFIGALVKKDYQKGKDIQKHILDKINLDNNDIKVNRKTIAKIIADATPKTIKTGNKKRKSYNTAAKQLLNSLNKLEDIEFPSDRSEKKREELREIFNEMKKIIDRNLSKLD